MVCIRTGEVYDCIHMIIVRYHWLCDSKAPMGLVASFSSSLVGQKVMHSGQQLVDSDEEHFTNISYIQTFSDVYPTMGSKRCISLCPSKEPLKNYQSCLRLQPRCQTVLTAGALNFIARAAASISEWLAPKVYRALVRRSLTFICTLTF